MGKKLFIEMIDISKKLLYPLILTAIVLLIVNSALYIFKCIPIFQTVINKYDLLRDILIIIFVIIGIISVGIYLYLKKLITESVEKDINRRFSALEGKLAILQGLVLWKAQDFDSAIKNTKPALDKMLEVEDEIWAKNNLAYFYAEKHSKEPQWDLKDEAIKFAEFVYSKYDKYQKTYSEPTWVETYAFVKSRFATGDEEK